MDNNKKLPATFWIVAGAGLVWNIIGLAMYYMSVTATPETIESMYETEAQVAYVLSIPSWVDAMFGLAVTTGVLGAVALLMRKRIATTLFAVSLAAVLTQNLHGFVLTNGMQVMGPSAIGVAVTVIVIGIALLIYAGRATRKGWIS
jgi:hypothetical protein